MQRDWPSFFELQAEPVEPPLVAANWSNKVFVWRRSTVANPSVKRLLIGLSGARLRGETGV